MIRRLHIENIAIIDRVDIDFTPGFNVLSGETGAGKSIIIDSLNAILGGRVSREVIRTGEQKAFVSAEFSDVDPRCISWLTEAGYEPEGDSIVISREMYTDGRNNCRVCGRPAGLNILRSAAFYLIGIHGQHDGRDLLDEEKHIDYLDSYASLGGALEGYSRSYDMLLSLNRKLKNMSLSASERQRRLEMLEYQTSELRAAEVQPGELERLTERRAELSSFDKIRSALSAAYAALQGDGEEGGAAEALYSAESSINECEKVSYSYRSLAARAGELTVLASELASDLGAALRELTYSPLELNEVDDRIELITRLSKKLGTPADELPSLLEKLDDELLSLTNYEDDLEGIKREYAEKRALVSAEAAALHDARCESGKRLSAEVERELSELGMAGARFYTDVTSLSTPSQAHFTRKGTDGVRFLLSANRGEELRPIAKVASGGELSRIMLAIKNVLPDLAESAAAVFDEIDTGVSGRAATMVGAKLYSVASKRQVLCVTHLPQIACLADNHLMISKSSEGGRTVSSVTPLEREGRIAELARLTGGVNITEATLKNAADMLTQAEQQKKIMKQEIK